MDVDSRESVRAAHVVEVDWVGCATVVGDVWVRQGDACGGEWGECRFWKEFGRMRVVPNETICRVGYLREMCD